MSKSIIVSPGTILKEYLCSWNITQKQLAKLTKSNEKQISNLINGKVKLTEEFAFQLETVFKDVKAEFWLELENAYRLYLLRNKCKRFKNLDKLAREYQFKYFFKGLNFGLEEQAEKMLNFLGANSFDEVEVSIGKLNYNFMEDGGDKKAIYLWLKFCEEELEIQNDLEKIPKFDKQIFTNSINVFKDLMYTQNIEAACKNIKRLSNELGIALVIMEATPNSKVRGATTVIQEHPTIFLSTRFKMLDTFYFAFIHEIAHIDNNDAFLNQYNISFENDEEIQANSFARKFFINPNDYQNFLKKHPTQDSITEADIIAFSKQQKIIPDILIGFLEHDKIIENHGKFYSLRGKIKDGEDDVCSSIEKSFV